MAGEVVCQGLPYRDALPSVPGDWLALGLRCLRLAGGRLPIAATTE